MTSVLKLTLITQRGSAYHVSPPQSYSPLTFLSILCSLEEHPSAVPIFKDWEVKPRFFEDGMSISIIWNSFAWDVCLGPSFTYLLQHLFTSLQTHGYLFHTLGYNLVLFSLSGSSNCSQLWLLGALSFGGFISLKYPHHWGLLFV